MFDFEIAAIKAAASNFEEAKLHGCFFHFTQNIWRHIQELGLQSKNTNDDKFAHWMKMLMALAFVPTCDIVTVFEKLLLTVFWLDNEQNELNAEKQALLQYFESTYIGAPGRTSKSRRRIPLFALDLWNMYDVTLQSEFHFFKL